MKIPAIGTVRYSVLAVIHRHGAMTGFDLANKIPDMKRAAVHATTSDLVHLGLLVRDGFLISLGTKARVHFGEAVPAEEERKPVASNFKPLRKEYMLGHSLNADRFRTDARVITLGNSGVEL